MIYVRLSRILYECYRVTIQHPTTHSISHSSHYHFSLSLPTYVLFGPLCSPWPSVSPFPPSVWGSDWCCCRIACAAVTYSAPWSSSCCVLPSPLWYRLLCDVACPSKLLWRFCCLGNPSCYERLEWPKWIVNCSRIVVGQRCNLLN